MPPADAYGVATFYALFALEPRPRRRPRLRRHCVQVSRLGRADRRARSLGRTEDELSEDGSATWLRSPCLGQCDRAPAAMVAVAGDDPLERAQAPVDGGTLLDLLAGGEPRLSPSALPCRPAIRRSGSCAESGRSTP